MKDLKGKIALLTGGSRGLGPYIGQALAREGVHIGLTARTETELKAVAAELTEFGVQAMAVVSDIREQGSLENLVEKVKTEFGRIDILVNNAGMEWVSRYTHLSPEFIRTMIETNQIAPMLLTRLVLPDMLTQGSGHVVTLSSLGGKKGSPYSATYAATKAGLIAWTSGIREELRGTGVSASVVCPGFVSEAGMFAVYKKKPPKLTGATTPEKVAAAVVRAIKKDVGEIVVNPGPIWPIQILEAIHPGIIAWLFRHFGVYDFYRRQAAENEKNFGRE
jgi:short-subunit dehydrogenase